MRELLLLDPVCVHNIWGGTKLREEFGMASSHFVVMEDGLPRYRMTEMLEKMEAVEGVEAVIAYDKLAPTGLPEFFLPRDLLEICKRDGMQLVMINSAYETASDAAGAQVEQLNAILKSYDPNGKMTGEAVLTKDLIDTTDVDFQVTSYISTAPIFLIIAITFR